MIWAPSGLANEACSDSVVCAVGGVSGQGISTNNESNRNLKPQDGTRSAKIINALAS